MPSDSATELLEQVPSVSLGQEALDVIQQDAENLRGKSPCPILEAMLADKKMDLERAKAIATRIMDPDYGLREYYEDLLAAFPELHLFSLDGKGKGLGSEGAAQQGRAAGDEFQRTIGVFFAIYWLVRIEVDGKQGFCYGVDNSWKPFKSEDSQCSIDSQLARFQAFYDDARIWTDFQNLLANAGIVIRNEAGMSVIDERTTLALLVLTAVHDLMKISILTTMVQPADAPYCGYSEGEVIADHDVAIFYIIDRHTKLLPCLRDLDPYVLSLVQRVLSGLAFNNGWFVQAEAPPGAFFKHIKAAMSDDSKFVSKSGKEQDLSLYFVHWLTDLAGGEPTPLRGCHKLTCRLPLHVLHSFMNSLRYIQQLAERCETEVMEQYLKDRWEQHEPSMGPLPEGPTAIAQMRLVCMAQGMAAPVLEAFAQLSDKDKEVLSAEMSRTGCENQSYSASLAPPSVREEHVGPAFLVYYGPAFLQRIGSDNTKRRLEILAEIYRLARRLWPASPDQASTTVTIRIDVIAIQGRWSTTEPETLLLRKNGVKQACIERKPDMSLKQQLQGGKEEVLALFGPAPEEFTGEETISQAEMIQRLSPQMLSEGKWYRKIGFAFLRPAVTGEVIVTMVNGKEETVQSASEGDFVVQANTVWKENYILARATVLKAYDLDSPVPMPEDIDVADAADLEAKGYKCFRSRTRIMALQATPELLERICPAGKFMASWGAPIPIELEDFFAAQVNAEDTVTEVYRIEKNVFGQTFVEIEAMEVESERKRKADAAPP
eukprot:TRINITY_DN29226_c0_g1_i1.p1 TRINITY_DN29226_c0_g1~~TRINITY_DN29226_c0_g1_i1.p1  ORF type:complete len:800 (-),score=166.24 TRINITY_DN29226_c0_g1_i1:82-2400(-)